MNAGFVYVDIANGYVTDKANCLMKTMKLFKSSHALSLACPAGECSSR